MRLLLPVMLFIVLMMAGCAANGPAFTPVEIPDPNLGLLYFYRPNSLYGCGLSTRISVDEIDQGSLKNNGYFSCFANPGKRMIEANSGWGVKPLTIYLDVEAGQEYYIRWWYDEYLTYHLAVIVKEYALLEIQNAKKSE